MNYYERPYSCSQCKKTSIIGNRGNTVEYTVGSRKYCFEEVTWFDGPYSCKHCEKTFYIYA